MMADRINDLPRGSDALAAQALRSIQGERRAHDFLARLEVQKADADELVLILAKLYGPELRGFVRVLARALQPSPTPAAAVPPARKARARGRAPS